MDWASGVGEIFFQRSTDEIPVKGSWKKTVKVWMMMMKEEIFAGHPSLAHPPLHIASLALALLALNPLAFAPLHSPLPRSPL